MVWGLLNQMSKRIFFYVVWQAKWKGKKPGIISIIDKEESNIEKQENLLYHIKICYK